MQSEQPLQRNDPLSNVPSSVNWERRSSYTSSSSGKSSAGRPDHFVDSQLTDDFQDSLTHLPYGRLEDHFENNDVEVATAEDDSSTAADNATNQQVLQQPTQETVMDDLTLPPEWSGCPPDVVMNCCRAMSAEVKASGMKEFYKSYSSWDKMTREQKNKSISWFRMLPIAIQGLLSCFLSVSNFFICILMFFLLTFIPLEKIFQKAKDEAARLNKVTTSRDGQTTKDDIARLLHLFKEPGAQRHWCNLYRVLNRRELDARKSGGDYGEAANPLSHLAELFNDYDSFQPQNNMVTYITVTPGTKPVKKFPWEPSASEWAYLATLCHELEPTNMARKHIIRDAGWIKSCWAEVRKFLHAMFLSYNVSGQHDPNKDEWGTEIENRRWARQINTKTPGSNASIKWQPAMVYAISLLDISDLESIGRKMPNGTGIDASVDGAAKAERHKKRKRNRHAEKKTSSLALAIREGAATDAKIRMLKVCNSLFSFLNFHFFTNGLLIVVLHEDAPRVWQFRAKDQSSN
jgi:hypothetical protein